MNLCACKKTGIDLEEYGCRYMGNPIIFGELDDEDYYPLNELALCWINQMQCKTDSETYNYLIQLENQIYKEIAESNI